MRFIYFILNSFYLMFKKKTLFQLKTIFNTSSCTFPCTEAMDSQSSTPVCLSEGRGFNIGDVCVDRTKTFNRANLNMQQVQIRKFNSDGSKAIVHYTHCPAGMVFAIDVRLLNSVDGDGFLRPSPYYVAIEVHSKRSSTNQEGCAMVGKKSRKE